MLFFSKSKSKSNCNIGQKGMTLIEVMVALSIFALVVAGALSLFTTAQSTQSATSMKTDVNAIRSAVRNLYFAQGTYGVADSNLNNIIIAARKVPNTLAINGTTITSSVNSAPVAVIAQGINFDITVGNLPTEICIGMITGVNGWVQVAAGDTAAGVTEIAQPVTVANAQTGCAAVKNSNFLRFRSN
jgi:hypothetical protein